jgi:hypothetical protein
VFSHLERLHDTLETPEGTTLHYWWIYATPEKYPDAGPPTDVDFDPYHASEEGVACVDDVARIAVAYCSGYDLTGREHLRQRTRQALEFCQYMQCDDGRFLNFVVDPAMNETVFGDADPDVVDGVRVNGSATSEPSAGFWAARACWAFGEGYGTFRDEDPDFAESLSVGVHAYLDVLEDTCLDRYGEYENASGRSVPAWLVDGDSYTTAPVVLGLAALCRKGTDERAETALRQLADGLCDCRDGDSLRYPFGAHLSVPNGASWHTWGLRQVAALARAGDVLDEERYVTSARRAVAGLYTYFTTSHVRVAKMGPAPIPYHQLSYGTDAIVHGCTELWRTTGESAFAHLGGQIASWYAGNNSKGVRMWDPETGRGYDGIYQDIVDWRSGAESTVAAVRTMLDVERYPDAARLEPPVRVAQDQSFTTQEGEFGTTDNKATTMNDPSDASVFSAGEIVKIFDGGTLTLELDVTPGEYRPYIVVKRSMGHDATVVLTVGEQRRTLDVGGYSKTYFWMEPLDTVQVAGGETTTVEFQGPLDRWGKIDAIVFQPAVATRVIASDDSVGFHGVARSVVDDRRNAPVTCPDAHEAVSVLTLDETGQFSGEELVAPGDGELAIPVEPRGSTVFYSHPAEE